MPGARPENTRPLRLSLEERRGRFPNPARGRGMGLDNTLRSSTPGAGKDAAIGR